MNARRSKFTPSRKPSKHKRAQPASSESQQLFQQIFHSIPAAILLTRLSDGLIADANAAFLRLTGFALSGLIGLTSLQAGIVVDPKAREERLAALTQGKPVPDFEVDLTVKSGEVRNGLVTVGNITLGGEQFALSTFIDITERRQAEERFRLAIESAPNAVIMVDQHGQIVLVNSQTEKYFGYDRAELIAKNIDKLVPERFRGNHANLRSGFFSQPQARPMGVGRDLYGLRKDGSEFPVEIGLTPIETQPGILVLASIVDITERKRVEAALSKSEALYRQIIETAHEGVWAIDSDNRTILANQHLADMFGYTIEEMMGKSVYEFMDEEGQAIAARSLENRRLGINEQFDFKYKHKDGSTIWAIIETSTLRDQDNNYTGALAMLTDITERKRAEAQLTETHKFLEKILIHSPVGILTYKFTGECLSANEYAASILGATIDQLHSQNFRELDSWQRSGLYQLAEKTITTHQEQKADINTLTSFGKRVWLTAQFVVFESGVEDCLLLTISDVTERKRADEALQLAYSQLKNLYDNLPQAVFSMDVIQNKMLQSSLAHEAIFGYPVDAFFKNPQLWYQLVVPEDKPIIDANYAALFAGQAVQQQYRILRPDGETRWLEAIIKPNLDEDGKPARFDGIVSDITERKQAEGKMSRQLARLTALSEIDRAISSSFDLQLSITTVLVHVLIELNVDAADVLLFDSATQTLQYATGQGFHSRAIEKAPISLSRGHAARAVLNRHPVVIIDLKEQPDDSPRSTMIESEGFVSYYAVPLFAKGELNGVLEAFRRSPMKPDSEWLNFLNTLAGQCAIAVDNATLFSGLQHSNLELAMAYDATIAGWSAALDMRDKETEGHSQRVTDMTLRLVQAMGISKEEQVHIRRGALLHDIGKMGIPDHILLKPDKLTDEEWVVMRKHPTLAYSLLSPIAYLKDALDIPYCHHEKWDGTGYPRGLKGENIPLAARIFAIVDVWDALRSDRPYRAGWPAEKVLEYIRTQSGTHFDPKVVKLFLRVMNEKAYHS